MAAGEGIEPSIFEFKARRVASYTIPQERRMQCPLPTLTYAIDQHAVVTLLSTQCACDFAGADL